MIVLPNGLWGEFRPCEKGTLKRVNENFAKIDDYLGMFLSAFSGNLDSENVNVSDTSGMLYVDKSISNNNGVILPDASENPYKVVAIKKTSANFIPIPIKLSPDIGTKIRDLYTPGETAFYQSIAGFWILLNSYTDFFGAVELTSSWGGDVDISATITRVGNSIKLDGALSVRSSLSSSGFLDINLPHGWTTSASIQGKIMGGSVQAVDYFNREYLGLVETIANSPNISLGITSTIDDYLVFSKIAHNNPFEWGSDDYLQFNTPLIPISQLGQ